MGRGDQGGIFFMFNFERENACAHVCEWGEGKWGGQREGIPSRLRAVSAEPNAGLNFTN